MNACRVIPPRLWHGLFAALALASTTLGGQTLEITRYRDDLPGALSLTFDDGLADHWTVAAPQLSARGLRGTFFVITGTVDWAGVRQAAQQGHEIGSHSTTDARLMATTSPYALAADAEDRLVQSIAQIEAEVGSVVAGYRVVSFAYPYGLTSVQADGSLVNDLASRYFAVSRVAGGAATDNSPDPLHWSYRWAGAWRKGSDVAPVRPDLAFQWVNISLNATPSTTPSTFSNLLANNAIALGSWNVVLFHSVGTAAQLGPQLDALAPHLGQVWVAPFGEVGRYLRQRARAVLQGFTLADGTLTYTLTDDLPDAIYHLPLTLRFTPPEGWTQFTATQNGAPLVSTAKGGYWLVEAVPDAGPIVFARPEPRTLRLTAARLQRHPQWAHLWQISIATHTGQNYRLEQWQPATQSRGEPPTPVSFAGDDTEHALLLDPVAEPALFRFAISLPGPSLLAPF